MEALLRDKQFSALDIILPWMHTKWRKAFMKGRKRPDGTPYFWHPSRVAKIVLYRT